jgi:hypothetical protein
MLAAVATRLMDWANARQSRHGWFAPIVFGAVAIAGIWYPWPIWLRGPAPLWLIPCLSVWVLTWRYTTRGFTFDGFGPPAEERWALLVVAAAASASPAALPLWLCMVTRYRWTVHEAVPRQLVATAACFVVAYEIVPLAEAGSAMVFWVVSVACLASHYIVPGVAKLTLGPRPDSWVRHARLDLIPLAAYLCGWPRTANESQVRKWARRLRRFNWVVASATVTMELAMLIALAHPAILPSVLFVCVAFHLGYFWMTGALFWELMAVDVLLALLACATPTDPAVYKAGANALFIAAVASSQFVWRVSRLAWWECRLVQRVFWEVEDGQRNTLALTHTFVLAREVDFYKGLWRLMPSVSVTENLCHTFLPLVVVRTLLADEPDEAAIRAVAPPREPDAAAVADHVAFLQRYFAAINAGASSRPLTRAWRWVESPGGYLSSGSRGLVYRGERPVVRVLVKYVEWYITDTAIVPLRIDTILTCPIDPLEQLACPH